MCQMFLVEGQNIQVPPSLTPLSRLLTTSHGVFAFCHALLLSGKWRQPVAPKGAWKILNMNGCHASTGMEE